MGALLDSDIQVDECLFKPLDKRLVALARGLVDKRIRNDVL
jgi:hypothetical protein